MASSSLTLDNNPLKIMNEHTAQVFVRDSIFSLTGTVLPPHLWGWSTLADTGIEPEMIERFSVTLGLDPRTVSLKLTLRELTHKVATESSAEVRIAKEGIFDSLL
jgi:hypothetical protein